MAKLEKLAIYYYAHRIKQALNQNRGFHLGFCSASKLVSVTMVEKRFNGDTPNKEYFPYLLLSATSMRCLAFCDNMRFRLAFSSVGAVTPSFIAHELQLTNEKSGWTVSNKCCPCEPTQDWLLLSTLPPVISTSICLYSDSNNAIRKSVVITRNAIWAIFLAISIVVVPASSTMELPGKINDAA